MTALLDSLAGQSLKPDEVIVADGSQDHEIARVVEQPGWAARGLQVDRIAVQPANAVRQRVVAIGRSHNPYLFLLDDDVVLEPQCLERLLATLTSDSGIVGVVADYNNQSWPKPTRLWQWYMKFGLGLAEGSWEGRVIGPLLRWGYFSSPSGPAKMEWLGAGNSLIRRDAYERAGGFSDFFLHRSTMNEDVDLGLKLARQGSLMLCPAARLAHLHAPDGRSSVRVVAEDDLYNRYVILRRTVGRSAPAAFGLVLTYCAVETVSGLSALFRHRRPTGFLKRLAGRISALFRIAVLLGSRGA